jgi:molybdopterin synthase catalytic subunit
MISIKILFLGPAREVAGVAEQAIMCRAGARVSDVRKQILERFPSFEGRITAMRIAVNQDFADDDRTLRDGDELALIPPVSGGSDADSCLIDLVHGPIPFDCVWDFAKGDAKLGGITSFAGMTRSETDPDHGRLVRLEYEAYETMARAQLERLAAEAVKRWGAGRVAVIHRLGPVSPGEASVVIAVACAHREESFAACRWLIDTLKEDVPIWKRDVFADGFVRWVEPPNAPGRDKADRP